MILALAFVCSLADPSYCIRLDLTVEDAATLAECWAREPLLAEQLPLDGLWLDGFACVEASAS